MVTAFYKGQGNGGVKEIKVEGGREKEKEVIVRREVVSSKWKTWGYDNFSRECNKTYSVYERETNLKKGE
jgi:hypothetical protein